MDVGDRIIPLIDQVPAVPAVPMVVDGVEFRLSLLSTSEAPYLATQIAFVASERMDGGMLECGTSVEGSPFVTETVSVQIGSSSSESILRKGWSVSAWGIGTAWANSRGNGPTTFSLGTRVPSETQCWKHVCTNVRPQKHTQKQRG